VARVREGKANDAEHKIYERCPATSTGPVAGSKLRVPFQLLSSAADITQGNVGQILRIVSSHLEKRSLQ
jgi:hypothetical protein